MDSLIEHVDFYDDKNGTEKLGQFTNRLLTNNLSSEALLISSLLFSEEDRNQLVCQLLASTGLKQSGSPPYTMMLISMGKIDLIFEDADYVEESLIPHWHVHCLFILRTMSQEHMSAKLPFAKRFFELLADLLKDKC